MIVQKGEGLQTQFAGVGVKIHEFLRAKKESGLSVGQSESDLG